jgi:hypothetical protein
MLMEVSILFQQIWLNDLPRSECGSNLSVNMQQEDTYQWGIMVGTPRTPKKGLVNIVMLNIEKTLIIWKGAYIDLNIG